jgi:hypothetical protein
MHLGYKFRGASYKWQANPPSTYIYNIYFTSMRQQVYVCVKLFQCTVSTFRTEYRLIQAFACIYRQIQGPFPILFRILDKLYLKINLMHIVISRNFNIVGILIIVELSIQSNSFVSCSIVRNSLALLVIYFHYEFDFFIFN